MKPLYAIHQLNTGFSLEELRILKKKKHFLGIKTDTKLTSKYHPENLVTNATVRPQARKSFSSSGNCFKKNHTFKIITNPYKKHTHKKKHFNNFSVDQNIPTPISTTSCMTV